MLESERLTELKVLATFDVEEPDTIIKLANRGVFVGPITIDETFEIKKQCLGDPELIALLENEEPLEQLGALLVTEPGYRFLAILCNVRIASGEPFTDRILRKSLHTLQRAAEFFAMLFSGKTVAQMIKEQDTQPDALEGEDSPNVLPPVGATSAA